MITGPMTHTVLTNPVAPPIIHARAPSKPTPPSEEPGDPRSRTRQPVHHSLNMAEALSGKAAKSPTAGMPSLINTRDP